MLQVQGKFCFMGGCLVKANGNALDRHMFWAIYQIMAAKHQIMTRSQLEKMNSEQLVQSFLMLQDEILGNQTELLQQNNTIDERLI